MKGFVCAALFALAAVASVQAQSKIVGTAILFRHGQRTPSLVFPNYGMTTETSELGLGQLTLTGSKQLYENGADLRNRYLHLFPSSGYFRANNMRILSSPVGRCVASLTSFLGGFFPPPAKDKTIPYRWQAIPFSLDSNYKTVVVNTDNCPAYNRDLRVAQGTFAVNAQTWMAEDKVVLDRVSAVIGVPLDNIGNLISAFELLQSNRFLDLTMPKWLLNDLDNTIKKYTMGYYRTLITTDEGKKVIAGALITEIINNMIALRDGSSNALNFLIYSGHDTSMSSLAKILGVDSQLPDMVNYGDQMAVELIKSNKGVLQVQVLYVNQKKKTLLNIPNCGTACNLDVFLGLFNKFILTDWNALCAL